MDRRIFLAGSMLGAIVGCGGASSAPDTAQSSQAVVTKGNRVLGLNVNEKEKAIDFDTAFAEASTLGLGVASLAQAWDDIETAPSTYSNVYLDIADAFYPPRHMQLALELNPLDTNVVRVPADLRALAFDDPAFITRYKAAITYALGRLPNTTLSCVVIGNEIDVALGSDTVKWAQYGRFFQAVAAHVRSLRPGVPVGAKVSFMSVDSANLALVLAHADALMLTYYLVDGSFMVRNPAVVAGDFARMVQVAQGKPIYLLEAGCPTSTANNSSPELQAQFVRSVFTAWDRYPEHIKLINFLWMHDISPAEVSNWLTYYGSASAGLAGFLGSLGLRTYAGVNKPGFDALRQQADLRAW
jgi:hypothetical protein